MITVAYYIEQAGRFLEHDSYQISHYRILNLCITRVNEGSNQRGENMAVEEILISCC